MFTIDRRDQSGSCAPLDERAWHTVFIFLPRLVTVQRLGEAPYRTIRMCGNVMRRSIDSAVIAGMVVHRYEYRAAST